MIDQWGGNFKYDKNRNFVCGKKRKIESLESVGDSNLTILLDKKKNIVLNEQFEAIFNLDSMTGLNSTTSFDVLWSGFAKPTIYRCTTTGYTTAGQPSKYINYCLRYDGKIYKIGTEFNNVLDKVFQHINERK